MSSIDKVNTACRWEQSEKKVGGDVLEKKSRALSINTIGLKSVTVDKVNDNVQMEVSAKILKTNYHNHISLNTFEQLCDTINSSGIISVDKAKLFNEAIFLKADFCNDLKVSKSVNTYFSPLVALKANTKYVVTRYNQPRNQGVVFTGNQTSFKERMVLYNKDLEIRKDNLFMKAVSSRYIEENFENVLRVEQNTVNLRRIKHYASTNSTKVKDVLSSSANPNSYLFQKIASGLIDLPFINEYKGMKLCEIEKLEGRKSIVVKCNYNIMVVFAFIESRVKGNISRYKKQYRDLLYQMENGGETEKRSNNHIKEIIELLTLNS